MLLSTYGGRGDVEPLVALAVRLRERGATVRACAPPDRGERLAGAGVPVVPVGQPVRPLLHRARPAGAADVSRVAAGLIAAQFATLAEAAVGCDALVATGLLPAAAGARSVAEKLGIRYVYAAYCPIFLPSPHHPPVPFPGRPFPPGVTDNRVLWDLNDESANALFGAALNARRASIGLPPVDNVYDYAFTDRPWLAADPVLAPWRTPADIDVTQTGAWIQPDERRLPAELVAFLDAGTPPVYVGFGSMPMRASTDIARVAIEAIRAQGRRAVICRRRGRTRPDRRPGGLPRRRRGQPAGTVSPGRRRCAPRRRGHDDDGRPGRRTPGPDTPDGGPALLGRPGGRAGHRHGARRPRSDHRVARGRAPDRPFPRDPRPSGRRRRHDPHRRGDRRGGAFARRGGTSDVNTAG